MRKIKFIIVHHSGGAASRTVDDIRRVHVNGNGWSDIGYHWLQYASGAWLRGRPEARSGAGVEGLNPNALHLCLIGNFNKAPLSVTRETSLFFKLLELQAAHPDALVLGHRETGPHLPARALARGVKPTRKQCPGRQVDMVKLRSTVEIANA